MENGCKKLKIIHKQTTIYIFERLEHLGVK
jgi:hypothetical protein